MSALTRRSTAETDVVDAGCRDRRRSGARGRRHQRLRRARLSRLRRHRDLARLGPGRRAATGRRRARLAGLLPVRPLAADLLRLGDVATRRFSPDPRPTPARRRLRRGANDRSKAASSCRSATCASSTPCGCRSCARQADYTLATARCRAAARRSARPGRASTAAPTDIRSAARAASLPARPTEIVRRGLGSSADATTTTADVRAYLPGLAAHHVVAVRLGGGASIGDPTVGRTFLLGGPSPAQWRDRSRQPAPSPAARLRRRTRSPAATSRSPTSSTAGRSRVRSAATAPGRCSCTRSTPRSSPTPATRGRAPSSDARSSRRRARSSPPISSPDYFAPFTVTRRRRVGTRRQRVVSDRVTAYFRVGKAF